MKKIQKVFIITILLLSVLLFYSSYASSYKFSVSPEQAYVQPGDEVLISLNISDIDAGKEGINVVETTLKYDEKIIENIDFIEKNDWKSTYNPNAGNLHGKLLYTKMVTGVTKDEEIGILKVKIKNNISIFSTEINLLQVTSNDGYNLMNDGDKKITLIYTEPTSNPDNNPAEETPTPAIQETPETPELQKNEHKPIINNVQTGDIIGIVVSILVLAFILYIVIKIIGNNFKNRNNHKGKQ